MFCEIYTASVYLLKFEYIRTIPNNSTRSFPDNTTFRVQTLKGKGAI